MEKAGGGGVSSDLATSAAGGMCDRFLTFLARNLTMSRVKTIADGPRNGAAAGDGHPPPEGAEEHDHQEEGEFAIPIERAEFDDYEFGGHGDGGYSTVATTILEESATATTKTGAAAAADNPVSGAGPSPAPAVAAVEEETTKVRKTVTIKEDRAEQDGGGGAPAATLERKRSLFKKRKVSSSAAAASGAAGDGGEQQRVPRRAGLRPRMPPVLRVPSNINERSSTFIEERRKSFGGRGGGNKPPAPAK
ncbi:unnamed protein product [Urochloa humidicola]